MSAAQCPLVGMLEGREGRGDVSCRNLVENEALTLQRARVLMPPTTRLVDHVDSTYVVVVRSRLFFVTLSLDKT